jgi:hypothetical protein
VQVLGRLALWSGILSVAGLSGWLAQIFRYETVFLLGLIVPAISVTGATLVRLDGASPRPIDWRILGGGLLFGVAVVAIGLGGVPFGQELVFLISVTIIGLMLARVAQDVDERHRRKILFAALVIFFYRATPGVGEGYRWFIIDVLGFDEAFYGTLGANRSRSESCWRLAVLRRHHPATNPQGPALAHYPRHHPIAADACARASPRRDVRLRRPHHRLCRYHRGVSLRRAQHDPGADPRRAPSGRRATWFALMASLMNVALVAGQLQTKYLNMLFDVDRGSYTNLPALTAAVLLIGFVVPFVGVLAFGRRAT